MNYKPKLIVFDLDYTLWPFWVDTHVAPPFRKTGKNDVVDSHGQKVRYYAEVPDMLQSLHAEGYMLGVASRTSEINGAYQLLDIFGWNKYLQYKEIYPGCKVAHFNNFKRNSGVDYKDMLFFDDENRNIVDINRLGATCFLVKNGMTKAALQQGLKLHREKSERYQ